MHCTQKDIEKADKQIDLTLSTGAKVKVGINIRPHVDKCLKELALHFELIVFTASHPFYADKAIDLIDPDKTIFSKRLLRENCIKRKENLYIKDLRIFNRDPQSILIVDNAIVSFAFQLDNGVPIIPFYDDKEDDLLLKTTEYLLSLKDVEDVRKLNSKTFCLQDLYALDVAKFLKYYYMLDEEATSDESEDKYEKAMNEEFLKIGKKVQDAVENDLVKLQEDLPKYLAHKSKTY